MKADRIRWSGGAICWFSMACFAIAAGQPGGEQPSGKGLTEQNKERLAIADMENIADWRTDTTVETTLSRGDKHQAGQHSLLFANKIDHSQGEKSYPIGWPRVNKDLAKAKLTDWSAYDAFECWIYAETSAAVLPSEPLGIGFSFSGKKQSSGFPLTQLRKDKWTKIVIPIAKLTAPEDVRRVQFHLSEANYKHGDRVDFYINDVVLTRFVDPAVNSFNPRRQVVYASQKHLEGRFHARGTQGVGSDHGRIQHRVGWRAAVGESYREGCPQRRGGFDRRRAAGAATALGPARSA